MIGGLPSRSLIPSNLNPSGIIQTGEHKGKEVEHGKKPEEYYPRLITAMRQIEKAYLREIKDSPELRNSTKEKKEFFDKIYKAIKHGDKEYVTPVGRSIINLERFTKFKEISPELYNKILSIAYDSFVNGDIQLDTDYLNDKFANINKEIKEINKSK
jgi:hypothetical protein